MTLPWHQSAFSQLDKMIKSNRLPHALLITGVEKIGKFELMQQLVGALIKDDEKIKKDNAREDLDVPTLIRRSNYQNMIYCRGGEIGDKTSKNHSKYIRVEQIRAFCEALNKTADKLQIGVLFYAEQMNIQAANSLLKTLEEPRKNTLIILLAHNKKNLPITIVSRCQNVHIAPAYDEKTKNWLTEHMNKIQTGDFDVSQLLENAHGVPFKVLEELNNGRFKDYQNYQNQLLDIALNPLKIAQTDGFRDNELVVLNCLQNLIIEGIKLKTLNQEGGLVELNQVVKKAKSEFLFKLLDDIYTSINLAKTTVNMKLLLDNILIVLSHITHMQNYPKITIKR